MDSLPQDVKSFERSFDAAVSVARWEDAFYRCQFHQIISSMERQEADSGALPVRWDLIRAQALFERNLMDRAKGLLQRIATRSTEDGNHYLYALARLAYMDGDFAESAGIFREIRNRAADRRQSFKGLLGMANAANSGGDYARAEAMIDELRSFEPLDRTDDRASLLMYLGDYYLESGSSLELAERYFQKALSVAAPEAWTYFITRAFYGTARVAERSDKTDKLRWILETLRAFVDASEQVFFSHLVNSRFKRWFSIPRELEFDPVNKRILVDRSWISFRDDPMTFAFLYLLHQEAQVVPNAIIASNLWPEEPYWPEVHDERIGRLAAAARHAIEACETKPVLLFSEGPGYKLASL